MKHLRSLIFIAALACTCAAPPTVQAADLSVTAANFRAGEGAVYITGYAGVDITAGQLVAISPSTGKFILADANDPDLCKVAGIAGNDAKSTRPVDVVVRADNMILGATLDMSFPFYVVSATPGGIAPAADLGAGGMYPAVVLVARSTTTCVFRVPALLGPTLTVAD